MIKSELVNCVNLIDSCGEGNAPAHMTDARINSKSTTQYTWVF